MTTDRLLDLERKIVWNEPTWFYGKNYINSAKYEEDNIDNKVEDIQNVIYFLKFLKNYNMIKSEVKKILKDNNIKKFKTILYDDENGKRVQVLIPVEDLTLEEVVELNSSIKSHFNCKPFFKSERNIAYIVYTVRVTSFE